MTDLPPDVPRPPRPPVCQWCGRGEHHPDAAEVLADVLVGVRYPASQFHDEAPRLVEGIVVGQQLDALAAAGLVVVREGDVPPWMTKVAERARPAGNDLWWYGDDDGPIDPTTRDYQALYAIKEES